LTRTLICLVEDYKEVEVMVTKMLKFAGHDVISAPSGAILDIILHQQVEPDLFLIDLSLPDESGLSIMRRLRGDARYKDTPMVALSALSAHAFRREAIKLGFDGFIAKPFDMATFNRIVRGYLKRRRVAASAQAS